MHYDVRLTAPDGYQTERSYSVASAPERVGTIDLTVERIEDGEVSPYLHDVVATGDQVEVRGPIGGDFARGGAMGGALPFFCGGSGGVPPRGLLGPRACLAAAPPAPALFTNR